MKTSFWVLPVILCAPLAAQTLPLVPLPFPTALSDYLGLSTSQVDAITSDNTDFQRWATVKQTRIIQVQSEIAQETAKPQVEPFALGARYAEIENICREIVDEAQKLRTTNLMRLTNEQQMKVKALEEVVRMVPLANAAQQSYLVDGPSVSLLGASLLFPTLDQTTQTDSIRLGITGCSSGISSRSGNFIGGIVPVITPQP